MNGQKVVTSNPIKNMAMATLRQSEMSFAGEYKFEIACIFKIKGNNNVPLKQITIYKRTAML